MSKLDNFKTAKWWEILLWVLGTFCIGVVGGATIFGSILSIWFDASYFSGILGAAIGVVGYYSYLFLKK